MISRTAWQDRVRLCLRANPVTAITGPRQCGKTTLARQVAGENKAHWFDCEDPSSVAKLTDPMAALMPLRGLVVIDEIQFLPSLFPVLRVLADRRPLPARFLILGSTSPQFSDQAGETLAGRVTYLEIAGFHIDEVGPRHRRRLWWRGGLPRSFAARSDGESRQWLDAYIRAFLERDIRLLGLNASTERIRHFLYTLANCHGTSWNAAELSASLGLSAVTVRRYFEFLQRSYMIRVLQPWHANLSKRQVKTPKIYIRDTGVLHTLLQIDAMDRLEEHPKIGSSWEGFVTEEVSRLVGHRDVYTWSLHSGGELDLFVLWRGQKIGVEVKHHSRPGRQKSMTMAARDLGLDRLYVVHTGTETYPLGDDILAIPFEGLPEAFPAKARGKAIMKSSAT